MIYRGFHIVFFFCCCINVYGQSEEVDFLKTTLRVIAYDCADSEGKKIAVRYSSGFAFKSGKYEGVITALHGVCGCGSGDSNESGRCSGGKVVVVFGRGMYGHAAASNATSQSTVM